MSSNIGKLETFQKSVELDSSATQEAIDDAAFTQYQLAELYWFQLNKPDTAMLEMKYVIDSFPTAYDAPKALIALSPDGSGPERRHRGGATRCLHDGLTRYPHSDYVADAMDLLGLKGTAADTGYAKIDTPSAEHYVVDDANLDSARYYYQKVVDQYPDSKFYSAGPLRPGLADRELRRPGDSSRVLRLPEISDSFPNTFWASEARDRSQKAIHSAGKRHQRRMGPDEGTDSWPTTRPASQKTE